MKNVSREGGELNWKTLSRLLFFEYRGRSVKNNNNLEDDLGKNRYGALPSGTLLDVWWSTQQFLLLSVTQRRRPPRRRR